jgi:hypothetical protein
MTFTFLNLVVIGQFYTDSWLMAQESTKDFQPRRVWMSVGAGPTNRTVILAVTASYSASALVYSVRLSGFKEKDEKFITKTSSSQLFQYREYAFFTGYITRSTFVFFSASGGISLVEGKQGLTDYTDNSYRVVNFLNPGLSLELNIGYTPLNIVGIGLTGYANFNKITNIFGALISLQLGRMY